MKIQFSLFLMYLFFTSNAFTQTTIVTGKITDEETSEDLIGANVVFTQNGQFKMGCSTDFDGNYSLEVEAGIYDVEVSYIGYPNKLIEKVEIILGQVNKMDIAIGDGDWEFYEPLGCGGYYKIPLIVKDNSNNMNTIIDETIEKLPTKNVKKIIGMIPGVSIRF